MRRRWLVIALFALLLAPSPGFAQEEATGREIIDDDSGDVQVEIAGSPVPSTGRYAHLDLRALHMSEDAEFVYVTVEVDSLTQDPPPTILERGQIYAYFTLGGKDYRVGFYPIYEFGDLYSYDQTLARWVSVRDVDVQLNLDDATLTAALERRDMQDANGASMHPAMDVVGFHAVSNSLFGDGCQIGIGVTSVECPVRIKDAMPDDGEPTGSYEPVFGVEQNGHIRLSSETPVRASNGDDTTYVYEVTLRNLAELADDVTLVAEGAPASWDVRIPASHVRIDANSSLKLPILVSTPFAHQHGAFQPFMIEAHSQRDPSTTGRVELGVRYTEVPQPAGHHNQLWIHSRAPQNNDEFSTAFGAVFDQSNVYFNAAQEDHNSDEVDVQAGFCGGQGDIPLVGTVTRYCWFVYLEPTLEMGLDFNLNGTGSISLPIQSAVPMQDAVLHGQLRYLERNPVSDDNFRGFQDQRIVTLGTFEPTDPTATSPGASKKFDTTFTPSPDADLVPFAEDGASMWMELFLDVARPSTFATDLVAPPVLLPGGALELPLFEYHDPVDDLFHSLTDVDIEMVGAQEIYVNPGETALFDMRIVNSGVVNDRFSLSIDGPNSEWIDILGDQVIDVAAGSARQIAIAVSPPLTAEDGVQADLIFEAKSTKDNDARALVRLLAEVDTDADHPDQSLLVQSTDEELTTKTVPAPSGILLVGLAAFLARRRA